MRTNRRIYEESVNLLQRENRFVCLTFSRPSHLAQSLSWLGMNMMISGAEAQRFSYAAMTLTVDSPPQDWPHPDEASSKYIFCADELPTFCKLLLKHLGKPDKCHSLRSTTIHIDIHNTWKERCWEMDHSASGMSRLHALLDPLRQLHSLGAVQIEGPLSASYKSSVIADLCKECPTATDVIGATIKMLDQGDEQILLDLPNTAINKYKTALSQVRSCCWINDEHSLITDNGPFPGLTARQTMRNVKVRVLARIASTYVQVGMLRMARIYVDRALKNFQRHHDVYQDLSPWHPVVHAEVFHVSALI